MLVALGTPIKGTPKPWKHFEVPAILVNAHEIIEKNLLPKIREKGGIHKLLGYDGIIFMDSGGFQAMVYGIDVSLDLLIKIFETAKADYYFPLDYPSYSATFCMRDVVRTISNYARIKERMRNVIPILHPPLKRAFMEYEAYISDSPEYIGIGGLVPLVLTTKEVTNGRKRAIELIAEVRRRFYYNIHVMGLGAPTTVHLLKALQCISSDSASWRVKAAYGKIMLPNGGERHVTDRKMIFGGARLSEEEKRDLERLGCPIVKEYGWEGIATSFKARALFNAWITLHSSKSSHGSVNGPFNKLIEYARRLVNFEDKIYTQYTA